MQIPGLGPSGASTAGARLPKEQLGKDDFLQLLVTQMRYQDPTNPMDNREFIAQLAQFSALEQMMNVSMSANLNSAMSMLGKNVQANTADGELVYGLATSVRMVNGNPVVTLDLGSHRFVDVELSKIQYIDLPQAEG